MKYFAPVLAIAVACQAGPQERPLAAGSSDTVAGASAELTDAPEPGVVTDEPGSTASLRTMVERYDFETRLARFDLPGRLDEISGLAFTPDGRLFAHEDERGRVYEIDAVTGEVGKRFELGDGTVRDDFEDITIVSERFFLISSRGLLYEFREGAEDTLVPFRLTDTGVGAGCEVEGLEYDRVDQALLIACKVATPDRGAIVVHRRPLDAARGALPVLTIARSGLAGVGLGDDFAPSGIVVDPAGTLLLVSGRHEALIEVTRSGELVSGLQLSRNRHPQPEGIAISPDGRLFISDEKNGQDARLTVYGPRPQGAAR